jgi:hypothetical protein
MIFFFAHYYISPLMHNTKMARKANAKLVLSLMFSVLLALLPYAPGANIVTKPGTRAYILTQVLRVEFGLDTALFWLLINVIGVPKESILQGGPALGGSKRYNITREDIKKHAAQKKGGAKPPLATKGSSKKKKAT